MFGFRVATPTERTEPVYKVAGMHVSTAVSVSCPSIHQSMQLLRQELTHILSLLRASSHLQVNVYYGTLISLPVHFHVHLVTLSPNLGRLLGIAFKTLQYYHN